MNWEVVNGITGFISAICALISIVYLGTNSMNKNDSKNTILSKFQLISFMLFCSGWVLSCLSFLWFIEPYGSYMSDKDYQNFFGVILGFPAVIILMYGLNLLQGESSET